MNSSPRYIQIQDFILEKINSHVWMPGSKIPTELELTKQFSVSRMTVNKAIRDLVNKGLLERTPRLGTFVCQKKVESSLSDIRNIADEIRQRGRTYSNKVTPNEYLTKNCPLSSIEHTVEAIMPSPSIQQHLDLTAQQPCLLLNRRTWSKQDLISVALLYHPADKYKLSLKAEI
ncbi:GntR family transcriptional regulator [Moritella viscosa]